jgi:ankyrin repeat protein
VGNSDIALYLLEHGAKPHITTAAMLGDTASVQNFLRADPSLIQAKGAHSISLLVHAVISSNHDLVRDLIAKGATDGASMALNIATDIGEVAVIQVLLEGTQPDVNWKNMRGKSALEIASENGQTEILALLER